MKKILEIGCGHGYNTYLLSKNSKNKVVGIDFSKENIAISKQRYPRVDFQVMNAERMRFKDNYFDEIYALDILEHVDHLGKVIDEAKRVLKQNGVFKINVPYYKSEAWLLKVRPTFPKEIHHVRVFKENQLDRIMKKKKFKLAKKQRKGFLQHVLLYYLFKRRIVSDKQTSIGSWRDNYKTKFVFAFMLCFDPYILKTPLKYFPIWIVTVPIGEFISFFGNRIFPKSIYYEFVKN